LIQAVLEGDHIRSAELASEALKEGFSPQDIVGSGLQAGMRIVGDKFSAGDFFVPEMLLAARAVARAMEVLQPHISSTDMPTLGRVVIGTVFGDIHDIGKNIVTAFLRGAGFEVLDLGINIPAISFIEAVKEHKPDILGMSALRYNDNSRAVEESAHQLNKAPCLFSLCSYPLYSLLPCSSHSDLYRVRTSRVSSCTSLLALSLPLWPRFRCYKGSSFEDYLGLSRKVSPRSSRPGSSRRDNGSSVLSLSIALGSLFLQMGFHNPTPSQSILW